MAKKDDNIILETMGGIKSLIRHRKGLKVFGKELKEFRLGKMTIHIDNEIPGIIEDAFENLGFITRDKRKPLIINKKRTDYGWHLVVKIPPGMCLSQFKKKHEHLCNAVNGWVDIRWHNGCIHLDVQVNRLPTMVDFGWDPTPYLDKMILPFPVGHTHKGLMVWDLAGGGAPHLLCAGETGFGKSNWIIQFVHCMLMLRDRVNVCVIDRKEIDFDYLKPYALVAETEKEALNMLKALWNEHLKRVQLLKKAKVKKIQDYPGKMKYFVGVIDEFAQLQDDNSHEIIDQIVRLSRATGIHLIAATQRPSSRKMDTDTRSQFDLRLCFPVASEIDSRMILGETNPEAAWLDDVRGRALFRHGRELVELQTMRLTDKKAMELLKNVGTRGWDLDVTNSKQIKPN